MVRIFLVRTQWLGIAGSGPGQELSKRMREEEVDKLNMNSPQSTVSQRPPLHRSWIRLRHVQGISCLSGFQINIFIFCQSWLFFVTGWIQLWCGLHLHGQLDTVVPHHTRQPHNHSAEGNNNTTINANNTSNTVNIITTSNTVNTTRALLQS